MPIDIPKKVREFAGMAEALAGLVELADKANAWQQQEAEHKARLAQLAADESAIRERIAVGERMIAEAQACALVTTDQAKIDGDTIRAKAAADADLIRDAANQAVEVAKAKERRAESDQRKAEAACATCVARLAELEPKVADALATIAKGEAVKKLMG
jgi:hypothetical protein